MDSMAEFYGLSAVVDAEFDLAAAAAADLPQALQVPGPLVLAPEYLYGVFPYHGAGQAAAANLAALDFYDVLLAPIHAPILAGAADPGAADIAGAAHPGAADIAGAANPGAADPGLDAIMVPGLLQNADEDGWTPVISRKAKKNKFNFKTYIHEELPATAFPQATESFNLNYGSDCEVMWLSKTSRRM